ncbi:MAG: pyrroloquinoline quinone biosynthesis protein PqqB [Flavobacteriaceae bacterium]|nr:pyrroloquinoline quinone biosynthesis protein PqqB [Flavobacteriaceae bacterium]
MLPQVHIRLSGFLSGSIRRFCLITFAALSLYSCGNNPQKVNPSVGAEIPEATFLVVLGTVQDAGLPQLGCRKACCKKYEGVKDPDKNVVALGLVDPAEQKSFLIEATPDIKRQLEIMKKYISYADFFLPDGILLTHAHIGHYTGLMQLGREAYNSGKVPVYAMPKMTAFLGGNGPWDQLVSLGNISLKPLQHQSEAKLTDQLTVTPLLVPHRDEYSETVGFIISGPNKKALFIPDIDKWQQWEMDIVQLVQQVDYAFLDATFYDENEINNRDMSEIPHPFVVESMDRFGDLPEKEKAKVYFIHFNHTNPLLDATSPAYQKVLDEGYQIAETHQTFPM